MSEPTFDPSDCNEDAIVDKIKDNKDLLIIPADGGHYEVEVSLSQLLEALVPNAKDLLDSIKDEENRLS